MVNRRDTAYAHTGREHDAMAQAMFTLERALAVPAPGRESQWMERAGAALAVVVDLIRQHVASAESDGGLIAELEVAQGHGRDARLAMEEHRRMLDHADRLLKDLSDGAGVSVADVRSRTSDLAGMLRQHRWLEADLIFDVLGVDIGTGD